MAKDLLARLRERALSAAEGEGGHLTDAEMDWFQNEQARQREARDVRAEQEQAAQRAAAMRAAEAAARIRAREQMYSEPYGQTYPEIESPQDLVRARVNQLASMPPSPEAARYAAGRQQVADGRAHV